MPVDEAALGMGNRWFRHCLADTQSVSLPGGDRVRIPNLPAFLATKFEAFEDRGDDPVADEDVEDIVTVLGYCSSVAEQVLECAEPLQAFLIERIRRLKALDNLDELVSGCFPPDEFSQSAVQRVLSAMDLVAQD